MEDQDIQLINLPDVVQQIFNLSSHLLSQQTTISTIKFMDELRLQLHDIVIDQFKYLYSICFEKFLELINISLSNSDSISSDDLLKLMESFEEDLKVEVRAATILVQRKSLNQLFSDLKQHVSTLQDILTNTLLKNDFHVK